MIYRELGKSGIKVSAIGLGTWAMGGGEWWSGADDERSAETIQKALDAGINLVDTAPGYGYGKSETVVGKAIKNRRDEVILSTKCGLWWLDERGTDFFSIDGVDVRRCLEPDTIKREIELSLKRLDTDHIDVYFTHWQSAPPYFTPIKDTMKCLMELKEQGLIRAIGASNVNAGHIKEYCEYGQLDVIQEKYSMLDRRIEEELFPTCEQYGISVMAYSPLEQGLLTGKIRMDTVVPEKESRNRIPWVYDLSDRKKVLDMLDGWSDLTAKYACSLSDLVVAWTMNQPGITTVLCGARKPEHILENAKAADVSLTAEEIARMRRDVLALGTPKGEYRG